MMSKLETSLTHCIVLVLPGPATVRMISNGCPPYPMPMQVPPGHMVQQIVDENGVLTHVILSQSLPPGMAPPGAGPGGIPPGAPMTVGYCVSIMHERPEAWGSARTRRYTLAARQALWRHDKVLL